MIRSTKKTHRPTCRGISFRELRCGTAKVHCRVEELREKIDSQTGEVIASNPGEIQEHDAATIRFETEPVVVERFAEFAEFGRFLLVKDGRNIGAGVVLTTNLRKVC